MNEPKTISTLMTLVMEECKKGNINNAIIYLNEAIEIEPNDARFYISRGTFRGTKNYEDAIEDYTKAIEIEPNSVFAYRLRADSKRKLGDYQGAIDDYTKAIEIEPKKAYLYNYRSESKRKLGDNEGADEDDKKADKLKDKSWQKDFLNMKSHSPSDAKLLIGGVKGLKDAWRLGVLHVEYERLKKIQEEQQQQ